MLNYAPTDPALNMRHFLFWSLSNFFSSSLYFLSLTQTGLSVYLIFLERERERRMLMEWEKQEEEEALMIINENNNNNGNYGMFVKVMTDEQLEILRKQIAIYASICEQLVELHKTLTSHQDVTGIRLGSLYCDPLLTSAGHKITGRQRWTPTPVQLQILERLFDQGIGTPSRQRIKDIATELSQHGQISDTNVYNWFQNRRARSKRKQHVGAPNNGESEVETEVESLNEKNTKPEEFESQHNPETSFGLHSVDSEANKMETTFPSNACTEPVVGMKQAPFYGNMLSNARDNHLFGKMEVSGSYNPYFHAEDYNTTN